AAHPRRAAHGRRSPGGPAAPRARPARRPRRRRPEAARRTAAQPGGAVRERGLMGSRQTRPPGEIWLRFLSGPDIDTLGLTDAEIVQAVEDVVAAHGRGETVF